MVRIIPDNATIFELNTTVHAFGEAEIVSDRDDGLAVETNEFAQYFEDLLT
jgi:hypothetical protein